MKAWRSRELGRQQMPAAPSFTTRPELAGTFGMVASTHWLASAAGMAVLEQGGTAFDAAVAAGLVLHVGEPPMRGARPGGCHPGGVRVARPRPGPGGRAARAVRAGRLRDLDAAAAALRPAGP